MTELFKGPEPIMKPCFECKNYDPTRQLPWCMKEGINTSQARAHKTAKDDCWESPKKGEKFV